MAFGDAPARVIHAANVGERLGVALCCCLHIPVQGFYVVLRHAETIVVQVAKVELSTGIILLGCLAVPTCCLCIVFRRALAFFLH